MSAPVRKVLPKVLGDHINSQPTFGLEISLSCYIANLQHGAENISGVKSVLQLPLLCQFEKKSIYCVWAPPISYLPQNSSKGEKDGASAKNASGNVLSISTSCFIKLQQKNVFNKWCSWGVNCQNVSAEKLLSHKTLFCQGSNFQLVSTACYFLPFKCKEFMLYEVWGVFWLFFFVLV